MGMTAILTKCFLDSDWSVVSEYFTEKRFAQPRIEWNPPFEALVDDDSRFLQQYWRDLYSKAGGVPHYKSIDAIDLKPILGHLMLLESLDQGRDFRYRVYGAYIAAHAGFEMTGKCVSDIHSEELMPAFFLAGYRAVLERRLPLLCFHQPPPDVGSSHWTRLIVPFADDGGEIVRLLVANISSPYQDIK